MIVQLNHPERAPGYKHPKGQDLSEYMPIVQRDLPVEVECPECVCEPGFVHIGLMERCGTCSGTKRHPMPFSEVWGVEE